MKINISDSYFSIPENKIHNTVYFGYYPKNEDFSLEKLISLYSSRSAYILTKYEKELEKRRDPKYISLNVIASQNFKYCGIEPVDDIYYNANIQFIPMFLIEMLLENLPFSDHYISIAIEYNIRYELNNLYDRPLDEMVNNLSNSSGDSFRNILHIGRFKEENNILELSDLSFCGYTFPIFENNTFKCDSTMQGKSSQKCDLRDLQKFMYMSSYKVSPSDSIISYGTTVKNAHAEILQEFIRRKKEYNILVNNQNNIQFTI